MNNPNQEKSRRILVIDDNRAIHDDFRKILSPVTAAATALDVAESELFGGQENVVKRGSYEIDSAYQGQDGVDMVKQALAEGRSYAMAFVDVRMPPGMDGVETTRKIWDADPEIQIVLCTAYSDYSWDDMFEKIGDSDGLLILKKPFDTVEALQLAQALTEKWWLHRQSLMKMEELENRVAERTSELSWKTAFLEAQSNSTIDGILVVNEHGKKIFQNQRTVELFKIPQAIADGNDDAAQVRCVAGVVKNSEKFVEKVRHLYSHPDEISRDEIELKDGTILDRYSAPVIGRDGKYYGRIWTFRDITARKQMEEVLQQERNLLRTLIDSIPDYIYLRDVSNRFVLANETFARLMGVSHPSALIGKRDADFYPPEKAAQYEQIDREVFAGRPFFNRERLIHFPNGQELTVLNSKVPFKNDRGEVIGIIGVGRDITERKQAEEALRQFQFATDQAADAIFWIKQDASFHYVNEQACRSLGYTREELMRLKLFEIDPAYSLQQWEEIWRRREQNPTATRHFEGVHQRKDGSTFPVEITSKKFSFGDLEMNVAFVRDITERKKMETHLIQSQKMETVGKLAGGIAHEFNSILTAIIGQAELLLEDLPAGSPLARNADQINQSAERAAVLTRQLLAYGRKQFLRPEPLNLNQVINGMSGVLSHLMAGAQVDVTLVPAAELKPVKVDGGQIEQVIMNLAMNARDAMPGGGKLTLETANVTLEPGSIGGNSELKPGEYVLLAVSDTGRGMSEEVKARAFEPFFTTKDVGQGTGLGLSTCYGIIKQSGGHINLYSEPGRGTTFKIYLPRVEPSAPASAAPPGAPGLPRGTETILLVEDDPSLREMAATLLRRLGYTVLTAANGVEALSVKQQNNCGHVDLLFTDVVMPHMSGKELADRVRALFPHTKILFTSAYTENAVVHQGLTDKDVALLQKPFTPAALARKLREVLDRKNP